jgi:hypothetical protein
MVKYKDGSLMHSNAFGERDRVPGWFVKQQEAKRGKHHRIRMTEVVRSQPCWARQRRLLSIASRLWVVAPRGSKLRSSEADLRLFYKGLLDRSVLPLGSASDFSGLAELTLRP